MESDLFQMLVALPNASTSEDSILGKHVLEIVKQLEAAEVRLPGSETSLIKQGREQYTSLLSARARHHFTRAIGILDRHPDVRVISAMGEGAHDIRDFHHDAYYAAFFVARYALVSRGGWDCSSHKRIREIIKRGPFDEGDRALAEELSSVLNSWETNRNDADYVFHLGKISALGAIESMHEKRDVLQKQMDRWKMP